MTASHFKHLRRAFVGLWVVMAVLGLTIGGLEYHHLFPPKKVVAFQRQKWGKPVE